MRPLATALPLLLAALSGACEYTERAERTEQTEDRHDHEESHALHERHHKEERSEHSSAKDAEHASEGSSLRLDPEILRDLRLTTAPVESRPRGEGAAMFGELAVNEEAYAEIGSPIEARAVRIERAPGQVVAPGDVLAILESAKLGEARAEYTSAKARVDVARRVFERRKRLASERIVPAREVEEAEAELKTAEAKLGAAVAALGALGVDEAAKPSSGARFELRSPIAGTVLDRDVVLGRFVEPSRVLFRVTDLSRLWLVVHAFERDAVRVSSGTKAKVTFPALPGRTFDGAVTFVAARVDGESRTVRVRIEMPNSDGVLRPGMSATAWVPVGAGGETLLAVPTSALQRAREGWVLFLPRGEGTFDVRAVGRGRDLGGEVEVLSGVAAGEEVVVDGAFLLKAELERMSGAGEEHHHH